MFEDFKVTIKRLFKANEPAVKPAPKTMLRGYDAALSNRLTQDWNVASTTIDNDIRMSLTEIRSKARALTQNDGYAKKFIDLMKVNVVGSEGFKLQVKARDPNGSLDTYANTLIEEKFRDWSRKGNCSLVGDCSFRRIQELVIAGMARDGEAVVRKIYNDSKYGYQLQPLEPDSLDETYNEILSNGNIIRMGIEYDAWNRPVAYHLRRWDRRQETFGNPYNTRTYQRIPANEIYHLYLKERPTQSRGVSWFAPTIIRLRMLSGYEDAALVNARVSAAKMGFLTSAPPDGSAPYQGDTKDANGNLIADVSPGQIEILPTGMKFESFTPEFPTAQYEAYVKSVVRGISSGLGVSYSSLSNDLADVNYSSIRAGIVEERELYKSLQKFVIENFLDEEFADWMDSAYLANRLGTLPIAQKFEKFNAPVWIGRRWQWVDPKSDAEAAKLSVDEGFKSRTMIMAEQGLDFEEVLEQLSAEQEMAKEYNISFGDDKSSSDTEGIDNGSNQQNAVS